MKQHFLRAIVAVILLFPATLAAQRGGPIPWWENPVVTSGLNLNERQLNVIKTIQANYKDRLFAARIEAEKAERELEAVYNSETADWAKGSFAIEHLVKARSEVTREISEMTLKLRRVLTVDQWRTLVARQDEGRRQGGPGRGPAWPGRGPDGAGDHERARRSGPPAIGSQPPSQIAH
ncbi:MAG: periplasmic heavy metal sensor [Acidobacteriota bacterium]